MTKNLPASLKTLALTLFLLTGQAAALVHDADHPFHEPSQGCDAFLALEKTDSSPLASTGKFPYPSKHLAILFDTTTPINSGTTSAYRSRAPPLFP